MGYAAVLWLDDRQARTADATELGSALLALLAGHDYPTGGLPATASGPWALAGAWHSTHVQVLDVTDTGIEPVTLTHAFDGALGWRAEMTVGDVGRRSQELLRDPVAMQRAMLEAGGDLQSAVWGPPPLHTAASVWWVHLDAMRGALPDAADLGEWIIRQIDRPMAGACVDDPGPWAGMLQRAGALVPGGEAIVVWSGNRVCAADQLTEREVDWIRQRLG